MGTIASKHKLNTKSIKDKYNALKEVEDGKTKSQVAANYGVPKNTLSTWLKNKDKIFEATKKGSNSKRQQLRQGTFANLDQAMFKWLLVVRSRDIIRSLKANYKTMSIKKLIEAMEKKKTLPEFSILDAMQMLDLAWGKVTTKTVVNCFEKAGISKEKQSEALLDADDPFKDLQEQLDKLVVYNPEFFPEGTTANDIVSVDDSLTIAEPLMTDDTILCDVLDEEGSETEDDTDGVSNEQICPQSSDVRQALDVLRECMLFGDNGEFVHKCLNEISVLVENELSAKLRQTDMQSFFE